MLLVILIRNKIWKFYCAQTTKFFGENGEFLRRGIPPQWSRLVIEVTVSVIIVKETKLKILIRLVFRFKPEFFCGDNNFKF